MSDLSEKTGALLQTSLTYGVTGGGILGIIEILIALPIYHWQSPGLAKLIAGPVIYMAIGAAWGALCHISLLVLNHFRLYSSLPAEADCFYGAANIAFFMLAWLTVWVRREFLVNERLAIVIPYMIGISSLACILAYLLYKLLKWQKGKGRLFISHSILSAALYSSAALVFCLNAMSFGDFISWRTPDKEFDTNTVGFPAVNARNKPNIILITPDTLRSDHLSCYGYTKIKTPAIDSLSADGVLFKKDISAAPWTLPSFTSLFTSLYPTVHGAGRSPYMENIKIGDKIALLPQILKGAGYYTSAIVNIPVLDGAFGFSRGFDEYRDKSFPLQEFIDKMNIEETRKRTAPLLWASTWETNPKREIPVCSNLSTTEEAIRWLGQNQHRPFFFWIHYYGLHYPYERCKSYNLDPKYNGRLAQMSQDDFMMPTRDDLSTGRYRTSQADKDYLRSLYDEELLSLDNGIGRILDELRQLNLADNTLIVFTSDHGEEFWEHGGFEHGHTLYCELLEVPLIIKWPGVLPAGKVIANQIRPIDVTPTILELLGIKYSGNFTGQSLLPLIKGEEQGDRTAFSENLYYGNERKAVTTGKYKLIYTPDSGEAELYDLEADSEEKINIAAEKADVTSRLTEELHDWQSSCQAKATALRNGEASVPVGDQELVQRLKSLGYF